MIYDYSHYYWTSGTASGACVEKEKLETTSQERSGKMTREEDYERAMGELEAFIQGRASNKRHESLVLIRLNIVRDYVKALKEYKWMYEELQK